MFIDLKKAKKELIKYVRNYDLSNERIKLKLKHTLKVMKTSKKLAKKLKLSKEDIEIATVIGLLHDIGRFEQVKQYDTFVDSKSVNHGELGVKILFDENFIRSFIEQDDYDEIIRIAILNHNKSNIQEDLNERQLLHCKIIRDADKMDIYRVLNEESINAIYGCESMKNQKISDDILADFFENKLIDYSKRKTDADKFVCHVAYVFDFYFDYSLNIIKDKKYIEKLLKRIDFKNPKTIEQVSEMMHFTSKYIENRLRK